MGGEKQAERDGVYLMIDTYAHEMSIDGGLFQAYLDVQSRFDRYSVSNAILITAQCPEATKLADFDTWKASGLYVQAWRGRHHHPGAGKGVHP